MSNFTKLPLTKRSIACRKLVHGIGVNDADYIVQPCVNGKRQCCPYYKIWSEMIRRCYSRIQSIENPSYDGCVVSDEWHSFMNFRSWMKKQDWEGKHLDKDILIKGNKIYSSYNCIFVSPKLNMLFTNHLRARGKYPQGVTFESKRGKYAAQCHRVGKPRCIGYFNSINDAEIAYKEAKSNEIIRIANLQANTLIKNALYRHAEAL